MVQITGTPTQPGSYTFVLQATDSGAHTATVSLTILVAGIEPVPLAGTWQFLLANKQPDGTYLTELTSFASSGLPSLTMRPGPGQTSDVALDLVGDSPDAGYVAELLTDIHVMRGSDLLFVGRVGACQDQVDANGHVLSVAANDYRAVLARRALITGDTLGFSGVEQALIAWTLITYTQGRSGGALGIARGVGQNTSTPRTMTFTVGDYIGDDINQIAQLDGGFEWQIRPAGQADLRFDVYYPQQGQDNGVVLSPGDDRVVSITRTTDPSTFGNAVFETGQAPAGGSKPTVAYAEGIGPGEDRFDKVVGSNITQTAALAADAAAQLRQAQDLTPAYQIVLRAGSWGGPADIWMGDTVTVRIASGRLAVNDRLRVAEMAFAIDANGQEQLTLTVGSLLRNYHKDIPAILRRLRYLETR